MHKPEKFATILDIGAHPSQIVQLVTCSVHPLEYHCTQRTCYLCLLQPTDKIISDFGYTPFNLSECGVEPLNII